MKRFLKLLGLLAILTGLLTGDGPAVRGIAQDKPEAKKDNGKALQKEAPKPPLAELLEEQIEMKDFQQPMSLKEALGLFYEKMANKGKELPILIDTEAFKDWTEAGSEIHDTQIKFPPFPRKMTLGQALKITIKNIPKNKAIYLVRPELILITTYEYAVPDRQTIHAKFVNYPLDDALQELARQTGIGIVLDTSVGKKAQKAVTVTFPPDTNLVAAVGVLADVVGLKLRVVDRMLYVTLPTNDTEILPAAPKVEPMIP